MKLRLKTKNGEIVHEIDSDVVSIGRSTENDFVIPLEDFSRKHCQITFKGEYAFITDLGSKNGVTVDGKKLNPHHAQIVYPHNRIVLANHFDLILPEGHTAVNDAEELVVLLEKSALHLKK